MACFVVPMAEAMVATAVSKVLIKKEEQKSMQEIEDGFIKGGLATTVNELIAKNGIIDVNIKKKGYIDPKSFYEIFSLNPDIETPKLIYKGKLDQDFIDYIYNYPVEEHLANPGINEKEPCDKLIEGVVARRSTPLKGQRMPKVKIKTKWWLDKIHTKFSEDKWKELE